MEKGISLTNAAVSVLAVSIPALLGLALWIYVAAHIVTLGPVADLTGQFFTSLTGAGAGAYFAFRFDRHTKQLDENRRDAEAASLIGIRMSLMYTSYQNYKNQFVTPAVDKYPVEVLWHLLPPGTLHAGPIPELDLGTLKFLFRGTDLTLVAEIGLEEHNYRSLCEIIDRRSRMHHEEMQPALERAGLRKNVSIADLEEKVGPRITQSMKDYTSYILRDVDRGLSDLPALAARLKTATKAIHPDERVIQFSPKPPDK
jgi:hypothetical protein